MFSLFTVKIAKVEETRELAKLLIFVCFNMNKSNAVVYTVALFTNAVVNQLSMARTHVGVGGSCPIHDQHVFVSLGLGLRVRVGLMVLCIFAALLLLSLILCKISGLGRCFKITKKIKPHR